MAPYPRKLTKAEFHRRNGKNASYQRYLYSYTRQKAAREARRGQRQTDPFAALLAAGPPLPSLDPSAFLGQAQQIAQGQLAPQMAALQAEAASAAAASRAQIGQVTGLSQAAGRLAQTVAPNIQRAYSGAAEAQAGFAKGFSDGMRELAQQDAARNTADLSRWGAPAEQISQVAGVGQGAPDALYATGGYIPASTMGREGAAYTAWASQMPNVLSRLGQQDAQALAAEGQRQRAGISAQIAAAQAQRPGLIQEALMGLQGQAFDQYQLARQAFEADRNYQLQLMATKAQMTALGNPDPSASNLFGYVTDASGNPKLDAQGNPIPTYSTQQDIIAANAPPGPERVNTTLSAANGYLTDNFGSPILGTNGQPVPYKPPKTGSGKRTAYKKDLVSTMGSLYKDIYREFNERQKALVEGGGTDYTQGFGAPGGAYIARPPSWRTAYNTLYKGLLATHTGPKGRWLYGLTNVQVRKWLEAYLRSKGLKKPRPRITGTGGRPGP